METRPAHDVEDPRDRSIAFGAFRLFPDRPLLLRDGAPVPVGARAMQILIVLVEAAGQVVSTRDLIDRVWKGVFVEEVALRVHIAALRKALAEGGSETRYLVNVPRRGYQFVAPTSRSSGGLAVAEATPPETPPQDRFSPRAGPLFGRDDVIDSVVAELGRRRLITLTGAGGIGKTAVAVAVGVAARLSAAYGDNVRFVDFSRHDDPTSVTGVLAEAFGMARDAQSEMSDLLARLKSQPSLLIFDSCEHLLSATGRLADTILRGTSGVDILATSREPLASAWESVRPLPSLDVPALDADLILEAARTYPAIQMFVDRAGAGLPSFRLTAEDLPYVADICRRVDGLPLAIEMVASRVEVFGLPGLAALLDDQFALSLNGRRTALPRHKTLRANLEWSFDLLSEVEQRVLSRIAVFASVFVLPSAVAVAGQAVGADSRVELCLESLAAKSLVNVKTINTGVVYALPGLTRSFALEKLRATGDYDAVRRLHAEQVMRQMEGGGAPAGRGVDDARLALDWAFSPAGDPEMGVALTAAAIPVWAGLSMMDEMLARVSRALQARGSAVEPGEAREMKLLAAQVEAIVRTLGPCPQIKTPALGALAIASRIGDIGVQLGALHALWQAAFSAGEFHDALQLGETYLKAAATASTALRLNGHRLLAITHRTLGNLASARGHLDILLAGECDGEGASDLGLLAGILMLQGFTMQATEAAERAAQAAIASGDALTICRVVGGACCPQALYVGQTARAEQCLELVSRIADRPGFDGWRQRVRGFRGVLLLRSGDVEDALRHMSSAPALPAGQTDAFQVTIFVAYAEALGRAGDGATAIAGLDAQVRRCEQTGEVWYLAELLRAEADLVIASGAPDAAESAELLFRRALAVAGVQGALAWRLRAALGLAGLLEGRGRTKEAGSLLSTVCAEFAEGFEDGDLPSARRLMTRLADR